MNDIPLSEDIEMLRVQIESSLPHPAILVLSSARDEDGAELVATRLAQSTHAAGRSTLLVLTEGASGVPDGTEPASLAAIAEFGIARYVDRDVASSYDLMRLPPTSLRQAVSRESVASFGSACRDEYAMTIITAHAALSTPFSRLTALGVDGIALTIRARRRICAQDRQLAHFLRGEKVTFLGVISVDGTLIEQDPRIRAHLGTTRISGVSVPNALRESPSR